MDSLEQVTKAAYVEYEQWRATETGQLNCGQKDSLKHAAFKGETKAH